MRGKITASLLALLVLLPATAAPLTPSGTVISHSFTARFGTAAPRAVTSNATRVTVKDLADPILAPPRSASSLAGRPVDFPHTISNRGNTTDSFLLKAILLQVSVSGTATPPAMRFYASDGVTPLSSDAGGNQVTGPLAPGASLDLVLRLIPAPGSEGRVDTITVTASSISTPARNSSLNDQLVVLASDGPGVPVKSVLPTGAVAPGTLLSYSIAVANPGPAPLGAIRVLDPLDGLLTYQQGSAALPAGLAGSASYDSASRTLSFEIPSMPAGFSGSLTFQAQVSPQALNDSAIRNSATLVNVGDGSQVPSNGTLSTVLAPALRVSKTAGSAVAEAGDLVCFTVRVENIGAAALAHATVSDRLPRGFRYLKGSTLLDGVPFPEPAGAGQQLSWDLGTLAAGRTRILSYRCAVSGDAPVGTSVNWASGSGITQGGNVSASSPASAAVKVRSSLLGDKAVILGRIFLDRNANGVPDPGEPGLPGVRVYLEDGSFTVSDRDGQYSFTGISAGNHVVKIDRSTLSRTLAPTPFNTAFAGVGWSQFITVPFGGPARGDFALAPSGLPEETQPPEAPAPAPLSPEGAAPGPAARLTVAPERLDMPADGKSVVPVTVELLNAQGRRVAGEKTVTLSLSRGSVLEPDLDPALPGHQIRIRDGIGVFRLRSPLQPGPDPVRISGDNGAQATLDLYFSSQLRDWIVVGLGNLTVGGKGVSGHLEKIDKEGRFEEGIFHEERLAFFARGKILGKYLLTAAYDSGKERRDGVFQAIEPEKYYPVYGDASDIGYEAQSRGRIYVKLETGRCYLLAGDYRTDLSENEFSRYDRALNGVKLELNGERASFKGFESRTEEAVSKDEIPGNGSSGFYFLSRKPVFENSERVRIEVRDRYHSERVLSVTDKLRFTDYSIDYNAGTILFKEPVPSLDQNLNPVTIVINYQSQAGGAERYVYGGRALLRGGSGSFIGGTAVVQEGSVKNSTLYGLDAGVKLGERITLKGEGALSDTPEKGRGSAWKGEIQARPLDALTFGAYNRKVEADFFNSSMTGAATETGTEKYAGRLDYRGLADTLLFAEGFVQKNRLNASTLVGNEAGARRKFSLFEGEGGFKRVTEEQGGKEGASNLLYAGFKRAITPRLDAVLRREQLLSSSSVSDYQTRTFLKLDYRITDATSAFVTEEYQEGSPLIRQATRFGLESRLSERMRLSTGYQLSDGQAGPTDHSNVDLNTKLIEREGFALASRSGYQLEHALAEERGQAILGLNSRLDLAPGVRLNSTLERVQTVQGSGGTRTAFTLAGEYLRRTDLKLTGRYEIRTGPGETASLYGAGLAYKLSDSLTLLGKATLWDKDADAGSDLLIDGYVGTAFRPLAGNPLQLLTLVRYKQDDKGSVAGSDRSRSLILSAEPTYRLVSRWSAQGKYAGKRSWLEDAAGRSYRAYTDLILAGISYDLAERWELALYLKLMNQYDTGQHSLGSVASVGYRVYRNVVLNAGYNYARLDDRDLTGESYQGQGPFVGVKVKFDEEMFETSQRKVTVPAEPPPKPEPVLALPPPAPPPKAPEPPVPALLVAVAKLDLPLRVSGSAELLTLLINGERARLPSTAVTVSRERLSGSVASSAGKPRAPLRFVASVERPELVKLWSLRLMNAAGEPVRTLTGSGAPRRHIGWDGEADAPLLVQGELYQYQLQVTYRDGSVFSTGPELFGVNRQKAVLLTLSGGAFIFDSSRLTPEAKGLLKGAARALRAHPEDRVIVEGHTDGIGTVRYNIGLSQRRCDAAADFLVREEGIASSRLLRRWYGKSRPIADNRTSDGRRLNRRVELKADFNETVPVAPKDRYRGAPFVVINDLLVPVDKLGRFETAVSARDGLLRVRMGDSLGRSLATAIPVPDLKLAQPAQAQLVRFGSAAGGVRVDSKGAAICTVTGGTEAGNTLELDGKPVPLDSTGHFSLELPLHSGEQVLGMVLRGQGCTALMNLRLQSTAREIAPGGEKP